MLIGLGGIGYQIAGQMKPRGANVLEFACIGRGNDCSPGGSTDRFLEIAWGHGCAAVTARGAAEKEVERIRSLIAGVDVLVVVAAMNGFAGGSIAPVIARVAKQSGIHTFGAVTRPAEWEGPVQARVADLNISTLLPYLDGLVTLDQERLYDDPFVEELTIEEFLAHSNLVLINAIEAWMRAEPESKPPRFATQNLPVTSPEDDLAAAAGYDSRLRQARRAVHRISGPKTSRVIHE